MKAASSIIAFACLAATAGPLRAQVGQLTGEQVVRAQCVKCHAAGVRGAPRIGQRDAWIPRMKNGLDPLVLAAIRGHDGMPARGGMASFTDAEFRAAVLYMFNATEPLR
jgi:cytochrome c5